MKRLWFFLISGLLLFCTAGSRDTITALDRAMVHAIGIDRAEEGFKVTLQIFRPDSAGTDTQLDPAKANIFIVSASAPTVGEAMAKCENKLGEFLFIGHNQLIVLGSKVSLEQSKRLFSYFIKSKESYLGAKVATAQDASELLSAELSEGAVSAQSLAGIIDRHVENSDTLECDLLKAFNAESSTLLIPQLALSDSKDDSEEQSVTVKNTAVYVSGQHILSLDEDTCNGLGLLLGEGDCLTLSLEGKEGTAAVDAALSRSRPRLTRNGDRLKCSFEVCVYLQNNQSLELLFDKKDLLDQSRIRLQESCNKALSLCYETSADLIGLSDIIRSRYPQLWLDCGGDFDRLLSLTELSANVRVEIRQ